MKKLILIFAVVLFASCSSDWPVVDYGVVRRVETLGKDGMAMYTIDGRSQYTGRSTGVIIAHESKFHVGDTIVLNKK